MLKIQRQTVTKLINEKVAAAPKLAPAFDKLSPTKLLPLIEEQLTSLNQSLENLKEAQKQLATFHSQKPFFIRVFIRFCDNHFGIGNKLKNSILATQKIANRLITSKDEVSTIVTRIKQNKEDEQKLRQQFTTIETEMDNEAVKGKSKETELEKAKKPLIPVITKPNAEKVAKLSAELSASTQAQDAKRAELLKLKAEVENLISARKHDMEPIQI